MRRRRPTEESRARAARISQALADLLPDEPLVAERPAERRREEGLGACPGCGAVLQRSAARHGIEIDACAECGGIWLDAGELEAIEAFIRAGGRALGAAARARAAQRLLPPPPPEPLPEAEARRVRRGTALVDVLWSLFFG